MTAFKAWSGLDKFRFLLWHLAAFGWLGMTLFGDRGLFLPIPRRAWLGAVVGLAGRPKATTVWLLRSGFLNFGGMRQCRVGMYEL